MKLHRILAGLGLMASVVACTSDSPLLIGEAESGLKANAHSSSPSLMSGYFIKPTHNADDGGRLSSGMCYANIVFGGVYLDKQKPYPTIFVSGTGGGQADLYLSKSDFGPRVAHCVGTTSQQRPLYSPLQKFTYPWEKDDQTIVVTTMENDVYGFKFIRTSSGNVGFNRARYDVEANSFGTTWEWESTRQAGIQLPKQLLRTAVAYKSPTQAKLWFLCYGVTGVSFDDPDPSVSEYGSDGIWKGTIPYGTVYCADLNLTTLKAENVRKVVNNDKIISFPTSITDFHGVDDQHDGCLVVNKFGAIKYVGSDGTVDYIYDTGGEVLTNNSLVKRICTTGRFSNNFITSGEGQALYYEFSGKFMPSGGPIYLPPKPLMVENGDLFFDSMPNPTVVDWDGDGVQDLVVGNSPGNIVWCKNYGSDLNPSFGDYEYICGPDGKPLCFRAGYYEVQGPQEACWGYIGPNVFDWNGDGLYDIVFGFNDGCIKYMLNEGTATAPRMGEAQDMYVDGVQLYGVWRQRPALARVDGRTYLMMFDTEERLHLYERSGNSTLIDRGVIRLTDGSVITGYLDPSLIADNRNYGVNGRKKLELADWNSDGKLDLIIGSCRQGSVPNPFTGLPNFDARGLQVIWLENKGDNHNFVFRWPRRMMFRGKHYNLGAHENSACVCTLGDCSDGPNMLVGVECGKIVFYQHDDLTWESDGTIETNFSIPMGIEHDYGLY